MIDQTANHAAAMAADAHRWLLNSGIRAHGPDAGAFRRQYDARDRSVACPYPEVSGYAAQLHLRMARNADDDLGRLALETGRWLCKVQAGADTLAPGAFAHAMCDGEAQGGWYAFDTSIIVHALVELARFSGDQSFARHARVGGDWLLSMQRSDGSFESVIGAQAPIRWAGSGGCLHAKHVLALADLYESSGDRRYADSARRVLAWVRHLQQDDGRIDAIEGCGYAIIHTQCYAIEGLIAGYLQFGDDAALAAALHAGRHLARSQRHNGGMPRYTGPGSAAYLAETGSRYPKLRLSLVPTDVGCTLQSVRIWHWLSQVAGEDYAGSIDRALCWVGRHQIRSRDSAIDGALPASVDTLLGVTRRELRLYPWVAVFAVDASRIRQNPLLSASPF